MLMQGTAGVKTEGKPALLLVFQGGPDCLPLATIRPLTRSLT